MRTVGLPAWSVVGGGGVNMDSEPTDESGFGAGRPSECAADCPEVAAEAVASTGTSGLVASTSVTSAGIG